uniref:Uncharacterized protein n=1 Tax=Arundo donax TaxID=35708 RepID=A0A0A9HB51_ARUDO
MLPTRRRRRRPSRRS